MIEVPVVAEGGITPEVAAALAGTIDFIALGEEIWSPPGEAEPALRAILSRLSG
jgi:thiamine monophosphate synthase